MKKVALKIFAQMAAKCNSRSDKRKIILQPLLNLILHSKKICAQFFCTAGAMKKLFHCLTQTAHSLQESAMQLCVKNSSVC
jgi:hypothetical protein